MSACDDVGDVYDAYFGTIPNSFDDGVPDSIGAIAQQVGLAAVRALVGREHEIDLSRTSLPSLKPTHGDKNRIRGYEKKNIEHAANEAAATVQENSNVEAEKEHQAALEDALQIALEAERKAQEAEIKAQEDRKATLEAERKAREAERKAQEAERKAQEDRKATLEAERKAQEAERKAQEAERKAQEDRKAILEAERKVQEAERKAQEAELKAQEDRKATLEAERKAQEDHRNALDTHPEANQDSNSTVDTKPINLLPENKPVPYTLQSIITAVIGIAGFIFSLNGSLALGIIGLGILSIGIISLYKEGRKAQVNKLPQAFAPS